MDHATKKSNGLSSSLPPSEHNILEGLTGCLVQWIVIGSSTEAHLRGLKIT